MNQELIESVKKFLGVAPYNNFTNICCGDPYFEKSIIDRYGEKAYNEAVDYINETKESK